MSSRILLLCILCACIGCTSFRTTVMQRSSDNRFYHNFPVAKTQGVPVKLKVPTHVEVRVIETFFLQNESGGAEGIAAAKAAANYAAARGETVKAIAAQAKADKSLTAAVDAWNAAQKPPTGMLFDAVTIAKSNKDTADGKVKDAQDAESAAKKASDDANAIAKAVIPFFSEAQVVQMPTKKVGERLVVDHSKVREPVKCLSVDTRLAYTDKVFTVDFRRPAGGVLNLTGVNMDSQQYFSAIQAAYQEETIQQVNAALGTLATGQQAGAIADTSGSPSVPTTVEIPPQTTQTIGADTRIVAFRRFDISDPDWEAQLHDFVARHVTGCNPHCEPPLDLASSPLE